MKYPLLFSALALVFWLPFSASAQLQTGFHYKIRSTGRYTLRYSTTLTVNKNAVVTVSGTDTTVTVTTPATPPTSEETKIQGLPAGNPLTTTVTKGNVTTTITDIKRTVHDRQHTLFGIGFHYLTHFTRHSNLKSGIKQKGDSLLVNFWTIDDNNSNLEPSDVQAKDLVSKSTGVSRFRNDTHLYRRELKSLYYIPITPKITLGTSSYFVSIPYATWEIGIMTVPFKYRFGNGVTTNAVGTSVAVSNQLSSAVNAGIYVGRKWGRTRFFADPSRVSNGWAFMLAAVGTPTIISISDTNTKPSTVTVKSDELGFSIGMSALASYGSLTMGVVGGIDHPLTGQSDQWIYADKFWLGFGLGYKFGGFGDK